MSGYLSSFCMVLIGLLFAPGVARADERLVPLAISGDWVALAHQTSITARPDVCLVSNPVNGVAFRAGFEGVQFRASNSGWSLPTAVHGTIVILIGDWTSSFEISDNTDTMVNVEVPNDIVLPMFSAMDKASVMTVTIGKAKPILVSLAGSTRATNAFRTCAGIGGTPKAPGANPFE